MLWKISRFSFLVVFAAALAASCSGVSPDDAEGDRTSVGTYDPADTSVARLHDVIALPGARLGAFAAAEIPIVEGPRTDARGRTVYTIMASGKLASWFESQGFAVEGHAYVTSVGDRGVVPFSETQCPASNAWPPSSEYFAWYDAHAGAFHGGINAEIQAMAAPHVTVKSIATTWEKRSVWAVRVGPMSDTTAPVPTVYVLGTHHAREWASEEVALELLRFYASGIASDAAIQRQLANAAIVFIPVANPDGYQYSRNPSDGLPGDRAQRKNRRSDLCATVADQGVDLNRNYGILWGAPSDSMSTNACDPQVFIGPSAASEAEVAGIQKVLLGGAFADANGNFKQIPTASISYHTYSDDLLYPGGFKLKTDANGPRCWPEDNCVNPDFIIYRHLFGDYENPVMIDTTLSPSLAVPTGMENTIGYTTSGDTTAFAQNASPPSLSVTPELTSKGVGFYIECESNYKVIIAAWVANQKTLISRVLDASPKLASTAPASSYGPPVFSAGFALTSWARETSDALTELTARARLVIGAFRPTDAFTPFAINVDGAAATAKPGRRGAQYDAYLYDPPNPLKLPCTVLGGRDQRDGSQGGGCAGPIDLCDPNRLPHDAGWTLKHAPRGGVDDCWWEPVASTTSDGTLTIPSYGGFPASTTQCQLMFTTDWDANAGGSPVILQRFHGGAWTEVTRWPFATPPIYETRNFVSGGRLRTEAVEINATVPGPTDAFRFLIKAGSQPKFQLFDPVVYCRFGPRP